MAKLSIADYQEGTEETAIYRDSTPSGYMANWSNLAYCALGLSGEAGEVNGDVKKALRDDGGFISDKRKEQLFKEIGDCMWYISQLCTELGFKLEDVLDYNLTKLADRQQRNVLGGSGDSR